MHARFLGRHLFQEMKVKLHCKLVVHLTTICVRKGQKQKEVKQAITQQSQNLKRCWSLAAKNKK